MQANYNGIGNVDFIAHNNSKGLLFLNIEFADLENTVFNEPIPYVKQLEPGFNRLFTLERYAYAEPPRFNYKIKYFRSHPLADVNLDFPYLIPFQQNSKIRIFDVRNIDGFWGSDTPKSWHATGFDTKPGTPVYACRNGIVVEIAGPARTTSSETWYHAWNNSITILQPDGTLICYHNVIDKAKNLQINTKIYAGQVIGEVAPAASEMLVMIYHNTLNENKDLIFIIPEFVVNETKSAILNLV